VGRPRLAPRASAGAVRVRRATASDLAAVEDLWQEYAREIAGYRRSPWAWAWEDVQPRLPRAAVFLAETGEGAIGFAIATRSRPDIGHVDDLYVRPAHRRRGIAAELLRQLVRAFRERGVEHVALDVDVDNEPARRLYERLGFTRYADRFAADVGELEDALGRRLIP
jgi:ribosomal protein S18 acetylase RimI-like enzyme